MTEPLPQPAGARLWQFARGLWQPRLVPAPARRLLRRAYLSGLERVQDRRRRTEGVLAWRLRLRLLVPVRGQSPAAVRATVASLRAQSYPEWEAYVVPDVPGDLPVAIERKIGPADPRVAIWREPPSGRPNAALNAAIAAPGADYVALVSPGDTLTEHALWRVAELLNQVPDADVVYTDEQLGSGWRARAGTRVRKPDWSPELAISDAYVSGLCVYRRALAADAGGLREEFDLAREYDLLLRLHARGAHVAHVPAVLHRRASEAPARSGAWSAEVARAVTDHLRRVQAEAEYVPPSEAGPHRVRYRVRGGARVSIVIPTIGTKTREVGGRTIDLLANTVRSIAERTAHRDFEIIYVHDRPLRPETLAVVAAAGVPVRAVPYDRPFNWSDKMNAGAASATGDHILALNDDVEVLDGEWLTALLEFSQQAPIGAVGGMLYFPDGSIQHAGVAIRGGLPGHPYYGLPPEAQAGVPELRAVRNCSAVTGACLMTRLAVFRDVGGFNVNFPLNYNDVDYCLRVRARGYRVVFTPHARLYHYEAVSRGRIADATGVSAAERERFVRAWPDVLRRDPFDAVRS